MKHVKLIALFTTAFLVAFSESGSHDRKKVPTTECEKNGWKCTTAGLADCNYKRSLDKDCHKVHGLAFCCVPKKGSKGSKKPKRDVNGIDGNSSAKDTNHNLNRQQIPPKNRRSDDEVEIDPVDDGFDHSVTMDPFGYDVYEEENLKT